MSRSRNESMGMSRRRGRGMIMGKHVRRSMGMGGSMVNGKEYACE